MHRLKVWQLFAICAVVWGTTWHAITYQLADIAPELSVATRFGLAGIVVLAFSAWRGQRLRFSPGEHAALALQGAFLYGVSYVCVYHAEQHVASGLVAVGYSASPLAAAIGARWVFGTRVTWRFIGGGVLGLVGVTLIFWPMLQPSGSASVGTGASAGAGAGGGNGMLGAAFTVAAVLLSTVGSLTASRNKRRGLPFWPSLGTGMLYGASTATIVALVEGRPFSVPSTPSWWLALVYLALAGSVLTFACFLTLQDRVGPAATGTVGVMTPLLALVLSLLFEGYRPDWVAAVGAVLAIGGNALMLMAPSLPVSSMKPATAPLTGASTAAE